MNRYDPRLRLLALCLAALAGYVDALGYLALDGYFVSFMSGNSTRLSISLPRDPHVAAIAGVLVALFVAGVMLGTVAGRAAPRARASTVMTLVGALLAVGAACAQAGHPRFAIACMTLAMGAENVAFERDGEVAIGLTYMTGTLVKVGQRLAGAFAGGDRLAWVWNALLWLGLVAGAAVGALVFPRFGLGALWAATAAVLALAVAVHAVAD